MKRLILLSFLMGISGVNAGVFSSFNNTVLKKVIVSKSVKGLKNKTIASRLGKISKSTIKVFDSYDFRRFDARTYNKTRLKIKNNSLFVGKIDMSDAGDLRLHTEVMRDGSSLKVNRNLKFSPEEFVVRSTSDNKVIVVANNGKESFEAEILVSNKGMKMNISHLDAGDLHKDVKGVFRGNQEIELNSIIFNISDEVAYSSSRGFYSTNTFLPVYDQKVVNSYVESIFTK